MNNELISEIMKFKIMSFVIILKAKPIFFIFYFFMKAYYILKFIKQEHARINKITLLYKLAP